MNTRFAVRSAIVVALLMSLGQLASAPAAAQTTPEIKPLTVELLYELRFGSIAAFPPHTGFVKIDPITGAKTVTGGAVDLRGIHGPAEFVVRGEPDTRIDIVLPRRIKLGGGRPGKPVFVKQFVSDPPNIAVIGPGGSVVVRVGATLQVLPQERGGNFTATFDILVDYAR